MKCPGIDCLGERNSIKYSQQKLDLLFSSMATCKVSIVVIWERSRMKSFVCACVCFCWFFLPLFSCLPPPLSLPLYLHLCIPHFLSPSRQCIPHPPHSGRLSGWKLLSSPAPLAPTKQFAVAADPQSEPHSRQHSGESAQTLKYRRREICRGSTKWLR